MTDEEYLFHVDAREKKIIGRSAYYRARPGKRVVLPSDKLTEKEIKGMSSEVKTYNLKNPMKYAEYKAMPDDLKKQYLDRLRERYNAANIAIADMFGTSDEFVRSECKRLGVRALTKGERTNPEWNSFIKYGTPERKTAEVETVKAETVKPITVEPDEVKPVETVTPPTRENTVDMINHPPHYTAGGVECIDAIAAATAPLYGMEAVCTAQIIKYIRRWKLKNGAEDLKKAQYYLNKLLEVVGA